MFGLGAGEILMVLVFALLFIGPKKLPELAKGLGKGIREFQKAKNELVDSVKYPDFERPAPSSVAQAPKEESEEAQKLKPADTTIARGENIASSESESTVEPTLETKTENA